MQLPSTIQLQFLSAEQLPAYVAQVINVYRDAFWGPPYDRREAEIDAFARSFPGQWTRDGFSFVGAFDRHAERLVGMAYGYSSRPGQWWYNHVSTLMSPEMSAAWLTNSFQLVELAVTPPYQGQGIGGCLHDDLLNALPHETALLSTLRAPTAGYHLYIGRGWQTLLETFYFPGVGRRYQIMGRRVEYGG